MAKKSKENINTKKNETFDEDDFDDGLDYDDISYALMDIDYTTQD